MVRDHTAVNDKALALVKKLNVTPEDNDTSRSLAKQADEERAKLMRLNGAAFDKAYVAERGRLSQDGQRRARRHPHSRRPERRTKACCRPACKIFQGHQQHAEQLASALK